VESTGKAAVAEFVGTFALILIGAGAVVLNAAGQLDLVGVALAHGVVLAIMVSISLHTSGGVFNPAVQLALWLTGKMSTMRSAVYLAAQIVGAIAGAFLLKFLIPEALFVNGAAGEPVLMNGLAVGKGILIEAVATFFLVWAVFGTAVDDRGPLAKTAGFTIGLVLTFDILAFGPYTGAAMNPVRWFGPALAAAATPALRPNAWSDAVVWIVGPLAGGIIAGVGYWFVFLRGKEPATP
jgi:aquaporin Z